MNIKTAMKYFKMATQDQKVIVGRERKKLLERDVTKTIQIIRL
jgi:hypothetical protein